MEDTALKIFTKSAACSIHRNENICTPEHYLFRDQYEDVPGMETFFLKSLSSYLIVISLSDSVMQVIKSHGSNKSTDFG